MLGKLWSRGFIILIISALSINFSVAVGAETVVFYHNDISGSPLVATDSGGGLLWSETYKPYGQTYVNDPHASENKIGFHGKPFDPVTGLSYMGDRYYNPEIGRFTGVDPEDVRELNPQSFNRYAYANNNPYKFVDPDGRLPVLIIPIATFIMKEIAAEAASQATGGMSDYLSTRRMATKVGRFAVKRLRSAVQDANREIAVRASGKVTENAVKGGGRSGKQARLKEMMNDPKVSKADRGWLKNDARHIENGNKSGLRVPKNGRKSPGRQAQDKGYELAHPHNAPASRGNSYSGSKLKNHADHKVETRLHRDRY